jgi:hypothetical protein
MVIAATPVTPAAFWGADDIWVIPISPRAAGGIMARFFIRGRAESCGGFSTLFSKNQDLRRGLEISF